MASAPKDVLKDYLRGARDVLVWKIEGLSEHETAAGIVELYRRVQAFADETIESLPLDAPGRVAPWGGAEVTLHEVMVHTIADLQHHAGHVDILREQIDSAGTGSGSAQCRLRGHASPQGPDELPRRL